MARTVEEVLDLLGIEIEDIKGEEIFTLCPWHPRILGRLDHKVGSFSINMESFRCYCFVCGGGGRLVDLIAEVRGEGVAEAVRWMWRQQISFLDPDQEKRKTDDRVAMDPEVEFGLFADVPDRKLEEKFLTREAVDHYQIRWKTGTGTWILPIHTPEGQLMGWQEKIPNDAPQNRPKGLGKSNFLFGYHMLEEDEPVTLVESPIDAARLRACGIHGAVSSYGSVVSDIQVRLLVAKTRWITLAMDNDEAGTVSMRMIRGDRVNGMKMSSGGLMGRVDLRVWDYSRTEKKDPGEMTDEECRWAYENALPAFEWKP